MHAPAQGAALRSTGLSLLAKPTSPPAPCSPAGLFRHPSLAPASSPKSDGGRRRTEPPDVAAARAEALRSGRMEALAGVGGGGLAPLDAGKRPSSSSTCFSGLVDKAQQALAERPSKLGPDFPGQPPAKLESAASTDTLIQDQAEMEELHKDKIVFEVLHERARLSPTPSPNGDKEPRLSRTITKDSAESALAAAMVCGPTWSSQDSDGAASANGVRPPRFSRQESEGSEKGVTVTVTPAASQRTVARGGGFGAARNSLRSPTVEARRPTKLITDKIEDEYEGSDDEQPNTRYASKQHPAQAVMTPGQVVSVWGATPSKEDRYTPFFSQKSICFDGDFSRMRHRVGVMSHRGHKPESPNQDDFFVLARKECVLFGVLDGHGAEGHELAHFAQERLPALIMERLREDKEAWEDAVSKSVKDLVVQSRTCFEKEAEYSGTTFTIAMLDRAGGTVEVPSPAAKEPIRLRCAFLGDSIAVCAKRRSKKEPWQVTQLTDIHRPDREDEARRILAAGGKIHLPSTGTGARLLTPDWNLAMSRSFGDFHAVPFGLSTEPEFSGAELGADQEHFVLVASDGVWDVIPPSQAVQLVAKYPPEEAQTAVEKLVAKAKMRWQSNEVVVDDITAVLIWPSFEEQ